MAPRSRPLERPSERERLALKLLGLLAGPGDRAATLHHVLSTIKEHTGYEAVGIHLIDKDGEDSSYHDAMTAGEIGLRAQDLEDIDDFESVAFVPVRFESEIIGILQLCDRKKDVFSLDIVLFFEEVGAGIGAALARIESEEQLRRVNAELEGFASGVAHDLRGPLSAAVLAGGILQELLDETQMTGMAPDIPAINELAVSMNNNVARATMLAEDILELARVGAVPENMTDIDIAQVIATVLEERAQLISERGIRVRVDDDLGSVHANATHVYRVFSNLLVNAMEHNDSRRPVVEVRVLGDEDDGSHRYLVRDNGSGMPGEQYRRVRAPLIRRKRRQRESGIGLSIVESILRSNGGDLSVYNDNGACFEVVLPDLAGAERPLAPRRDPASPKIMRTAA